MDLNNVWNQCVGFGIQQKQPEFMEFLEYLVSKNVKTVLEIGCYSFGSTRGFLEIADKVTSIDGYQHPNYNIIKAQYPDKFEFFNLNSQLDSTKKVMEEKFKDNKVDFLFIDGDHSASGSLRDFELYKDLVKEGGIIAFHDIVDSNHHHSQGCYVDMTWKEISQKYKSFEIVRIDREWAGIGVIEL